MTKFLVLNALSASEKEQRPLIMCFGPAGVGRGTCVGSGIKGNNRRRSIRFAVRMSFQTCCTQVQLGRTSQKPPLAVGPTRFNWARLMPFWNCTGLRAITASLSFAIRASMSATCGNDAVRLCTWWGNQEELRTALSSCRADNENLRQQLKSVDVATEPSRDEEPNTQTRNSMEKLIIGMAVGGYGYDPRPERSKVTSEICDDLQRLGVGLDQETVLKYLKRGAKHVSDANLKAALPRPKSVKTKPKSG